MPYFSTQGAPATRIEALNLPRAVGQILRLNDLKARVAADIAVRVSDETVLMASLLRGPIDGPTGVWGVRLDGRAVGEVTLTATHNRTQVAAAKVSVFEPEVLALPPESGDEGLMARLLVAEALSPAFEKQYVAADVETSMRWMAIVVRNRMNHPTPSIFKVPAGVKATRLAVVSAPGQFHGFESYPALGLGPRTRIAEILQIANNYADARRGTYAAHLKAALAVAATPDAGADPVAEPDGLYGWRKQGTDVPGGSLRFFKDFAGQTFYKMTRPPKR